MIIVEKRGLFSDSIETAVCAIEREPRRLERPDVIIIIAGAERAPIKSDAHKLKRGETLVGIGGESPLRQTDQR